MILGVRVGLIFNGILIKLIIRLLSAPGFQVRVYNTPQGEGGSKYSKYEYCQ